MNTKTQQIAHSSAALLLSNAANKVTGFLIMLSVARYLGAEQFGLYTFVFSYVWVFGVFSDLGLTSVVAREISKEEGAGRVWLGNAIAIRWAASLVVYAICVGSSLMYNGWSQKSSLIALSALTFFYAPLSSANAVFTAKLKLYGSSMASLVSRLALWAAIQVLARKGASVAALIMVEVILGGITTAGLWIWARRLLSPSYRLDRLIAGTLLTQGIPLLMTSVFIALYFRMDVFFLEYFVGAAAVGSYAAAYRLTEAIPMAATAFTSSLFPVICQLLHQGEEHRLQKLLVSAQKILMAIVTPVLVVLTCYALPLVGLLYAGRFDSSSTALAILSCGQVFVFANILSTTLLVARNQGPILMGVTMGMVPLNALLNYLVIPGYGVPGAAATTVATEFAAFCCLLLITKTAGRFFSALTRVLPPALLALLFAWTLQHYAPAGLVWQIPLILILYGLSIRFLGVFDQEEWDRLKKALP